MKVINLFAGPGAGKSTTAARLFTYCKDRGINVELVTEYAKDLTWEQREDILQDQLYVTAKQNRRLARLKDKVDFVITDSPLLLGYQYALPDYFPKTFKPFVVDLWNSYDNHCYFLGRVKPYRTAGRSQTEQEAVSIDGDIRKMLKDMEIKYLEVNGDESGAKHIFTDILAILALPKV